jgi:EAL domain-containing protein (putative c-di-GMP-specific phosphodiesterase class I)
MKSAAASPAVFIPIAESTGWIRQIGRITTEKAVRQIAEWQKAGAVTRPVSINFSAAQLGDKQFIQFLKDLLKTTGVSSSLVEIEITESLFMRDSKQAEELMKEFRDMPVLLLMDDFGTGYSSLSYLTYIPVSTIKIDKSLIDTYLVPGRDSFIRDVINLSHDLGKKVTCEGVETRMQYERLKEFGCDVIQGYYFSKPLPAGAVPHFRVEAGKL